MLLERYLRQPDRILSRIYFEYEGGRYLGKGVMTWNPSEGFYIESPVERAGPGLKRVSLGGTGVVHERELRSIRMREQTLKGWILAPRVIMRDRWDVVIQQRLSIPVSQIIISQPRSRPGPRQDTWNGSVLLKLKSGVTLPDRMFQEQKINDQLLGKGWTFSGILCETETGQRVKGWIVEREYLEIYYSLPRSEWSHNEAWTWAEAARDALSLCLGQEVALLEREMDRNSRVYTDIRVQTEVHGLGQFAPLGSDRVLDRNQFFGLANFLAKNRDGAEVCRRIFAQMVEAVRQRTWQGSSLLLATILEAALRTLEGHPFRTGDKSYKVRPALARFRQQYLTDAWEATFEQAVRTFIRLRDRNAHPDWLYEETGALSDGRREEIFRDMISLSRFYGYMILALAGFKDLRPPP